MTDMTAPRAEEFAAAENWWKTHFGAADSAWPFSFVLDGNLVSGQAHDWQCSRQERRIDDQRDELVITATQPAHGLMDAGWYPCWLEYRQKNAWWITGTWEPDRKRFPKGQWP